MTNSHAHMGARFSELEKVVVNDSGEFSHRCLACNQVTGHQYEDYCAEGCRVLVTECSSCVIFHEAVLI